MSAAAQELLNKHQANISRLAQAFGLSDQVGASQQSNKSDQSNKSNQPPGGPQSLESVPSRLTS